jgi:nucleoside-diphosphate-sugar epimerase
MRRLRLAKFLVTGGAGFIGSGLVDALVASGDSVRVLDDFSTGKRENLPEPRDGLEVLEGDVSDPRMCRRAVQGMDYVLHHAAMASVPKSLEAPDRNHEINVQGTFYLLLASRDAGVRRFVLAASSAVYGESEVVPKREEMEPDPVSPYALSKLIGEGYCRQFTRLGWLSCTCLRYFNIFGPRQDPASEYAAVVPIFITRLLEGKPASIYGDGEQTRDFTYLENAVRANLLAVESDRAAGGVYNIGCGESFTLNDLFSRVAREVGTSAVPEYLPVRPGDVRHSCASIERAKEALGYEPVVGFEEGLHRTVEWFAKHRDRSARGGR